MEIIRNVIVAICLIIMIIMIALLVIDKRRIKKNLCKKVKSAKYISLITAIIIMFIAFGLLRNF